ncbi:MAG: Choline-sulfatase [uncultured Chloroflexi bacterium]|uniref:Choline-sulfatase n=1 Tax=uncultured Chloroflexota bacterium TaxID=166587 RepID=A0A6J4IL30_9CHLR|nr:MAG: Choline-sulfatase [uncultured Chloroflexota bacterium]
MPDTPDARPNVLFIMSDQQQYATAGPAAAGRSPHLERLAQEGAWCRRGYTVTNPCAPARVSIVTGLYPHRHGVLNNLHVPYAIAREARPDCDSWGRRLTDAGYRMRYVGKWHAGYDRGPADLGFDTQPRTFDAAAYRQRLGLPDGSQRHAAGAAAGPGPDVWGFHDAAGVYWRHYGRQPGPPEATATAMQAEAGIEQLRALSSESGVAAAAPWCLWMNFTGPHNPYVVPEPYASMYHWRDVPVPASFDDDPSAKPAYVRKVRHRWFRDITEEHTRKAIAHYWGYCTMIDHYVGQVLAALDETGQAENTIVVYTSDHGDMMGAHNLWFKDVYGYEETHRMPFILRWPRGIAPGTVIDDFVRTLDLGPTFLDAAGAEPLDPCHGVSLLPLLRGEPGAAERLEHQELFVEEHGNIFYFVMRQVCDGRFKLTWNAADVDELYDLQDDPHEMRNLAEPPQPAHQAEYLRLCDRLWDWMLRLEDPYAGRQYAANVTLPRSTPPPMRPDARGRVAAETGHI